MFFGRAFTGSQEELEIGITAEESGTETEKTEEATDSNDTTPETEGEGDTNGNKQPGRYVFVKVDFKEANLGERPVEPVAPEMPEELQQAAELKEEDATNAATTDSDVEATDEAVSDSEPEGEEAEEDPLAKIREEYESTMKNHEIDMVTYESDIKAFEKKIADGTKKANDLNRRFAEWYYVVPGETFDKLRLSREDIVKAKEQPKPEEGAADPSEGKIEIKNSEDPAPTENGKADPETTEKEEAAEEKTDTVEETAIPTQEPSSEESTTDEAAPETEPTTDSE
jgi:hypothetical protein